MKFKEWIGSKKTKDMILTFIVLLAGGALNLPMEVLYMIAGLGGVKIGAQGIVDAKKAQLKK